MVGVDEGVYEPQQQQQEEEEEEDDDVAEDEDEEEDEPADAEPVDPDERVEEEDDDEEDDEGQNEYEKDGFLVDDVDEEEQDEDEEDVKERHKKKRKKKRESEKNYQLDDDDYELLQDNNVAFIHRPKPESKKFKRLKKAQRDSEEVRSGLSDEEEFDGSGKSRPNDEETIGHDLFGDEEGPQLEDIAEGEDMADDDLDMGDDVDNDDEMADFIVNEDEVDEHGVPVRRKVNKKKSRLAAGVSCTSMRDAQDIFGDVEDLLRIRDARINDDIGDGKKRTIENEFEPSVLEIKYMTERDQEIRGTDIPEMVQVTG